MRPKTARVPTIPISATLLTFVLTAGMAATPAQAQNYKFKVLHTFHGKDGAVPYGLLVRDSAGNLYGTTADGDDRKNSTPVKIRRVIQSLSFSEVTQGQFEPTEVRVVVVADRESDI